MNYCIQCENADENLCCRKHLTRKHNLSCQSFKKGERSFWHEGTPAQKGEYFCAFEVVGGDIEYGWCTWDGVAWDINCTYDPRFEPILAWFKFKPFEKK